MTDCCSSSFVTCSVCLSVCFLCLFHTAQQHIHTTCYLQNSIIIVQQKNARTEEASVFFLSHREQQQQQYTYTAAVSPQKERITITGNIIFFCLNSVSASRWMTDCCSSSFVTCFVCLSVFCAYFTQHSSTYIHAILILLYQ